MDPPARSPALICTGILLTLSMFAGFFGVFLSIWKSQNLAVPSFLFLEIVSVTLLNIYSNHMRGTLFTRYNRGRLVFVLTMAVVLFAGSLAYAIFLLVAAIRQGDGVFFPGSLEKDGMYLGFLPCLVASFWSGLLIYEARRFIGMFDEQYGGSNLPYRIK